MISKQIVVVLFLICIPWKKTHDNELKLINLIGTYYVPILIVLACIENLFTICSQICKIEETDVKYYGEL